VVEVGVMSAIRFCRCGIAEGAHPTEGCSGFESDRPDLRAVPKQGAPSQALSLPLGEILDDVRAAYSRYIGFTSQAQPVAITLWTAHTHCLEAADCTPYIRVSSAEPESGKTRTEEIAFHLVHSGVRASSVSASAVFRLIDAHQPTLLVDGGGRDIRAAL
jgi:hypothetical protein